MSSRKARRRRAGRMIHGGASRAQPPAQPLRRWPQDQASCGRRSSAPPAAPLPTKAHCGYVHAGEDRGVSPLIISLGRSGNQAGRRPRSMSVQARKGERNGIQEFSVRGRRCGRPVRRAAILDATPASARCRGSIVRGEMAHGPLQTLTEISARSKWRSAVRARYGSSYTRWGVANRQERRLQEGRAGPQVALPRGRRGHATVAADRSAHRSGRPRTASGRPSIGPTAERGCESACQRANCPRVPTLQPLHLEHAIPPGPSPTRSIMVSVRQSDRRCADRPQTITAIQGALRPSW